MMGAMEKRLTPLGRRILGVFVGVLLALLFPSCTPQQGDRVVAVLQQAASGCVRIEKLEVHGKVEDVCVSLDELRKMVAAGLAAKEAIERIASPSSSASAAPPFSSAAPAASSR